MNDKAALKIIMVVLLAGLMTSCNNKRDYSKVSRATGWDLTGKDGLPFYNPNYKEQVTGPGLVFIEGGTFTMGKVADNPMHDWNNTPTQQTVSSFYMDETEVTNGMYLEYVNWLKLTFPPSEKKYALIYKSALPDTTVWRSPLGQRKALVTNYFRSPSYFNYPVVGVTWIQAVEFSQWRTNMVNEKILEDAGLIAKGARFKHKPGTRFSTAAYLLAPKTVFGGNDSLTRGGKNADKFVRVVNNDTVGQYASRTSGLILPAYRLPTEAEWEYAALALTSKREYNNYRGRKKYPWDGMYTVSQKRMKRGDQLANFKQGYGDYAGVAGWTSDDAIITNEVKSYPPNAFGLYDMAGNVAEWVADVYRPRIDVKLNDFNYYRGNVYTENVINKDGTVSIVSIDSLKLDTLRTGKIVAADLPGDVARKPIPKDQMYLRTNYDRSDNRNYAAGDKASSRYYWQMGPLSFSQRMYNSPVPRVKVIIDSTTGKKVIVRQVDSEPRTTLISKRTRVVKGGSWKDNAFWLDPAQRRFYPQGMATDWIGFRNAMSRVGSSSKKGRRARN